MLQISKNFVLTSSSLPMTKKIVSSLAKITFKHVIRSWDKTQHYCIDESTRRVVIIKMKVVFFDQDAKEEYTFVYYDNKMNLLYWENAWSLAC